jgi:hypothetical protein
VTDGKFNLVYFKETKECNLGNQFNFPKLKFCSMHKQSTKNENNILFEKLSSGKFSFQTFLENKNILTILNFFDFYFKSFFFF